MRAARKAAIAAELVSDEGEGTEFLSRRHPSWRGPIGALLLWWTSQRIAHATVVYYRHGRHQLPTDGRHNTIVKHAPTCTAGAQRPILLLVLLGLAAFFAIFDEVIALSSVPLLRNPAAIATALALGLWVWYRRHGVPIPHGAMRWIIAFLLYTAVVESLRSVWTANTEWLRYLQWVQVLALAIITIDLARDRRVYVYVWGGITAAVSFMAVATVTALPGFTADLEGRVGFAGVNLNTQGYWYALAAATFLWWMLRRWPRFGWEGVGAFLGASTVVFALVQTASRSALISLVVGVSVVLIVSLRAKNLSAYATVVPAALLLLGFFIADATVLQDRFARTLAEGDFGARESISEHALDLLAERPWFGYGPSFLVLLGEARNMSLVLLGEARNTSRAISSHNSFFQVALTFGLPALLLWVGIVSSALVRSWRSYTNNPDGVGGLMLSLIALSMIFAIVGDLGFNKYFWTMIALASQSPLRAAPP